jgi:hypothetical protein
MLFSKVFDSLHLLQSILFVAGGFLLPVNYLPVFICGITWMLTRYHDYCIISEFTRAGQNFLNGCKEDKDYSRECLKKYEEYGIYMTPKLSSNIMTAMLGINVFVSLYRMSVYHKFPIIYHTSSKKERTSWYFFIIFLFLLVLTGEAIFYALYESDLNLPECNNNSNFQMPTSSTIIDSIKD